MNTIQSFCLSCSCSVAGDGDTRAREGSVARRHAGVRRIRTAPSTNKFEVKPVKASTRSKAEGKLREVEGALKEAVGEAAMNRDLQAEGRRVQRVGKVQGTVGRGEKAVGR
jgi:uncharacterized protein YjbJ (UPF0337 family)